jgi:GNAT superfamily N-acetyltransferase
MEIRKAEPKDFEQVFSLILEFATFIKTPEKVKITAEQMTSERNHFECLLAVEGERIVGFATYFMAYYTWTGKAVYLDDLYVSEAYRGKGIGGNLFDSVIEAAKAAECKKLRWQVSNWNKNAIDFYKSRGATIDEVEINCDLKL